MPPPFATLRTVEIPVSDLQRAIRWYGEALGDACGWSDPQHALLAREGDAAATQLLLVQTDDPTRLSFRATHSGILHGVLDFETDDLDAAHAHLARLIPGLAPIPEPAHAWAPRGFGFLDSEGNRLALFSFRRP